MALDDYIRSPLGLLNAIALILNLCAIVACGLQWTHGVALQIIFMDYIWLTGAQFLLFGATMIMTTVLILCSFPRADIHTRLTGGGLTFLLAIALVCELGAIVIIVYYIMIEDRSSSYFLRFIAILILAVLFLAVAIIMVVLAHKYLNRIWAIESPTNEIHESVHTK